MAPEADQDAPARRLWRVFEPLHAVVYFDPGAAEAMAAAVPGWWRGYFAGRAAPLGAVGAGPVTAAFFGFHPAMVARALPGVWARLAPSAALDARVASGAAALRRLLPGAPVVELAGLLGTAAAACRPGGRVLGAAWAGAAAGWAPGDPWADLWLACTVLREHRGDGHVAAWTAAGVSGLEATALHSASGVVGRPRVQPHRGWSDAEWDAAEARLRRRGLLDDGGGLSAGGRALQRSVEDRTDELAAGPVAALGADGLERVLTLGGPPARALVDGGTLPVPNPIGVAP